MDPARKWELEKKVSDGVRLAHDDGCALAECDDLSWLGRLAHGRRAGRYGDRVTFVIGGPVLAPAPTDVDRLLGAAAEAYLPEPAASPAESLRGFALARLLLDDGVHIAASLPLHGTALAQLALNFGADDLVCPADANREDVVNLIWDAGLRPVERDAGYAVVRDYDPPVPLAERRAEPQRIWA
ncbi:hypothetical protein WEI85_34515 [Actinomycetes bacterium KLBMP 9797]